MVYLPIVSHRTVKAQSVRLAELSLTSALCKTLYTDNVTLKSKHEALLARLPGTRTSTPTASRPSSPFRLEPPALEQSPSYSAVAFPGSPEPPQPLSISRLRRTRKISVTPAELAMLSDQNAELIEKLEMLETESLKADQAGKRKLRKLEQEIQDLRDELDRTQARGAELEEQAKAAVQAVNVQKRKEEREARLQALKEKSTLVPGSDMSAEEIRDFAPPSWMPASRSSPIKRSASSSSASAETSYAASERVVERALASTSYEDDSQCDEDPESYFPTPPGSSRDVPPPAEYAIVSQLLIKIRELEETNAQIKEQQKLTEDRMRAAQWDAESIRRVYDCLDDGDVDLEIQEEDDRALSGMDADPALGTGTIRFSSLRRTIVGDMSRLMSSESDVFARGINKDMQSTVRDGLIKASTGSKARKTVVGLFDTDADTSMESAGSSRWGEYPPTLRVSPAFRSVDAGDISTWSSSATDGIAPPSPSISTLPTPLDGPGVGRTLGSELGSEFGDDWAERGINHHLRASSLVDLAGMYSSPASPSESVAVLPPISFPTVDEHPEERWEGPEPSTPPRIPDLQLQPPTPTPDKLRPSNSTRQYRLSQTVRARTSRWVEGRFQPSPSLQESLSEKVLRKRSSSSTLGRRSATDLFRKASAGGLLSETFDSAVGQIKRVASRGSFSPLGFASSSSAPDSPSTVRGREVQVEDETQAQEEAEADRSVTLRPGATVVDPKGAKQDGIVGFVLEAWLWLQFAIVVALFLWTMAKRGPKVVLEAERRNASRAASKP